MIFQELRVGSPGAVYPPSKSVRVPFAFPTTVQTAHAVLQSFHLEVADDDAAVHDVVVMLWTHFDPLQSTTSGEVEVEFRRTDSTGASLFVRSDTIEAQVRVLVVGI